MASSPPDEERFERASTLDGMTMERLLQAEKSVLKAGQATLEAWNMMTSHSKPKSTENGPASGPLYTTPPDHLTEMKAPTITRHSSYTGMATPSSLNFEIPRSEEVPYARGSFTLDSMESSADASFAAPNSARKGLPALNIFGLSKSVSSGCKTDETTHTFTVKKADNFLIDNLSKKSSVRISIDTESRMLAFLSPTNVNEKEEYSCAAITARESSKLGLHLNIQQGQAPPITRKIAFFSLDDRQRFMETLECGKIKCKPSAKKADAEMHDEGEAAWDSTPNGSYSMPDTETELERLPGEEINQKVQRVTNLVIIAQKERAVQGELIMTNYRVVFFPYDPSLLYGSFEVPLAAINVTKFEGMKIIILCKDLRKVCLSMHDAVTRKINYHDPPQPQQGQFIQIFMSKLRPPLSVSSVFAFTYHHAKRGGTELPRDVDGWLVYSPVEEYKRLGFLEAQNSMPWRLLKNTRFLFSPTYPQLMVVPFNLDKDQLVSSVKFRSRGRLPIAVWRHPDNKCVLSRSSQPMYGLQSKRCEADRQLLKAYRDAAKKTSAGLAPPLHIVDARKVIATQGNRLVGKGVEQSSHYDNAVVEFLGIANIHKMRDSIEALQNLVHPTITDDGHKEFHSALHDTRWLKHIMKILSGGCRIAQILHEEGASVLVHCSDGWDRTPQLCGIAELILDPHYRTIRGFAALVEKEWCSFGHKFHDRVGVGKDALDLANERSPVFLQFLDAVWQMTRQFPTAFEFNERFLLHVVDAIFSGLYGTFLFNTEKERADNTMWQRTESVWSGVLEAPAKYTNLQYQPTARVLYPRANLKRVVLWEALFFRWDPEMHPAYVESLDPLSKAKDPAKPKAPAVTSDNLRIAESFTSTTSTQITEMNDNSDGGSSLSDTEEDEGFRPSRRPSLQRAKSMAVTEKIAAAATVLSPDRETVVNLQQTLAQYPQQATERARQRSKDSSLREALEMVPDKTRIRYLEQLLSQSVARELQLESQLDSLQSQLLEQKPDA
ncbi:myotubularin-like protein [Achlya hypogyna]|uniref:Myotubularin-like protein n=1 Tax=Achlya hypogyna TaxID=1202772 RepID=A0A1V9YLH6_ACHHY|nr:myotubularin-like protein [Achlya hypogyna]